MAAAPSLAFALNPPWGWDMRLYRRPPSPVAPYIMGHSLSWEGDQGHVLRLSIVTVQALIKPSVAV